MVVRFPVLADNLPCGEDASLSDPSMWMRGKPPDAFDEADEDSEELLAIAIGGFVRC